MSKYLGLFVQNGADMFVGSPRHYCYLILTHPLSYRLKVIGAYGFKNKREVWRVQFTLAKIRYETYNTLLLAMLIVYICCL